MTNSASAISVLGKNKDPFILMIEGASIDKESHPNNAAGQLWDTIEFDKAIKVGRAFAGSVNGSSNTLVLITADHDQSILIQLGPTLEMG